MFEMMTKSFLHLFLSLLLSFASLTSAHHHDHGETISITDIGESDSHCDLCAMKYALHSCQLPEPIRFECSFPTSISFEPSYSSHVVFHFCSCLSSRAPPHA